MKEYLVFIKDCLGRLCDRLRNEYHEQPVQDIRRTMSQGSTLSIVLSRG